MLSLTLSACSTFDAKDGQVPPQNIRDNVYHDAPNPRFSAADPVSQWWVLWDDPLLHDLIHRSLRDNFDIAIAKARIDEARALLRETQFDYLPTVEAYGQGTEQRLPENNALGVPIDDRNIRTYEAGFDAVWEIDLFGRISEAVKAQRADLDAQMMALYAAYVSTAAEVARAYIDLRGTQRRYAIAKDAAKVQKRSWQLTRALFIGGDGNALDTARAKTLWQSTEALLPAYDADIHTHKNRLAVLLGEQPNALNDVLDPVKPLPSLPKTISVGQPEDILYRRPDVRIAENTFMASSARYNVTRTDLYPRLSLEGGLGYFSTSYPDLFQSSSEASFFTPIIRWSIFDLGHVMARIRAADARTRQDLANFQQTVLLALEEVDTSMVRFAREENRRQNLYAAAVAAQRAANLARQRYHEGLDNFLSVLDADRENLAAQDQLALGDTTAALNLVALYKSLGGGWDVFPTVEAQLQQ